MREECLPGGRTIAERVSAPAAGGAKHKGLRPLTILVHGKEVKQGEVTAANADMLHMFDVKEHLRPLVNEVSLKAKGETNLIYLIVGRHFETWRQEAQKRCYAK